MALNPQRIEIDAVYKCPDCGSEKWYTAREMEFRNVLDCVCGTRTEIAPIQHVKVTYTNSSTQQFGKIGQIKKRQLKAGKVSVVSTTDALSSHLMTFVDTLVSLGHKKPVAEQTVRDCSSKYDGDDNNFLAILMMKD